MNAPQRVSLRTVEDRDLALFFEYQADAGAAAMAAVASQDRDQFDAHWAKIRLNPTGHLRTVLVDGAVAGHVACWQDQDQEQWLIGYWIGRGYWGRGVATQAIRLFVDEVTNPSLHAHVAAHNAGSIRVLEKCGFHQEQVPHAPGPGDGIAELHFVLTR
ncbi:GNAT family N-acetyltransferase [Kineosporia sp. NBRC 101731]|uniref:GNAT family N-acetyltransferase n=1 Tax=Kineosporia sp. NBRC 101731 TaxID=3032199 RepID=UPI0025545D21|nr:GNAT family N-acetyltransferase [Kineosporia sp. NBRC 101731]